MEHPQNLVPLATPPLIPVEVKCKRLGSLTVFNGKENPKVRVRARRRMIKVAPDSRVAARVCSGRRYVETALS